MPSISKIPFLKNERYGSLDETSISPSMVENTNIYNKSRFEEIISTFFEKLRLFFVIRNPLLREFLAEIFGTFIFLSFSLASVAQFIFSGKSSFLSVNISFGVGLSLAIVIIGKISGGHMNPAVSFSMLLLGRIPYYKFIIYSIGQYIGAFFASLMVYLVYLNQLVKYKNGMYSIDTAGIFATYPNDINDSNSTFSMFFDQFFSTTLFIITILAITDKRNNDIPNEIVAILIGLSLTIIGSSYGFNCGFAVNPARDFAPRIFTAMAGWGSLPFTAGNYFFWIPLIAPMFGSLFGTFLYSFFVSNHWPVEEY